MDALKGNEAVRSRARFAGAVVGYCYWRAAATPRPAMPRKPFEKREDVLQGAGHPHGPTAGNGSETSTRDAMGRVHDPG